MRFRRALVTGGAGFIGSHLCRGLLEENMEVVALDNLSVGQRENLPSAVRLIEGDIRDPDAVKKALEYVDIVFHQAARVSIRSSAEEFLDDADQNIMGTLSLIRSLRGSRVEKFINASSMAVYSDNSDAAPIGEDHPQRPLSPYGVSKLACEHFCSLLCGQLDIEAVSLRYFNTYGTHQRYSPYVGVITIFAKLLLQGKSPQIFDDGEQNRDFVQVGDVVQSNLLAMKNAVSEKVYNVGTGTGRSVNQIAALLIGKIAPGMRAEYVNAHGEELRSSVADISLIRAELGYRPCSNLETDIDQVIAYIQTTL